MSRPGVSRPAARRGAILVLALTLTTTLTGPAQAAATRASLTDIETDVMCVVCHEPLAVSQSPQANAERDFIRGLIAQGQTKPEIERALVAQYGPAVLAKPPAHGFNLLVYVLPAALVGTGMVILAVALPRWRRRTRAAPPPALGPAISPEAAQRLDSDLAAFDG